MSDPEASGWTGGDCAIMTRSMILGLLCRARAAESQAKGGHTLTEPRQARGHRAGGSEGRMNAIVELDGHEMEMHAIIRWRC
jgi:hypothetical protein